MCLAKDQFTSVNHFFQKPVQHFWWWRSLFFIDCLVIVFLALLKKAITVTSLWAWKCLEQNWNLNFKGWLKNFWTLTFSNTLCQVFQGSFSTNLQRQHHTYMNHGDGENYLFTWPTGPKADSLFIPRNFNLHYWYLRSPLCIFKSEIEYSENPLYLRSPSINASQHCVQTATISDWIFCVINCFALNIRGR